MISEQVEREILVIAAISFTDSRRFPLWFASPTIWPRFVREVVGPRCFNAIFQLTIVVIKTLQVFETLSPQLYIMPKVTF